MPKPANYQVIGISLVLIVLTTAPSHAAPSPGCQTLKEGVTLNVGPDFTLSYPGALSAGPYQYYYLFAREQVHANWTTALTDAAMDIIDSSGINRFSGTGTLSIESDPLPQSRNYRILMSNYDTKKTMTGALLCTANEDTTPNAHDFNADGYSDIVWRDSDGNLALWFIIGSQVAQSAPLGVVPANLQLMGQRDFNGDGFFDLLWRDNNTGAVAIWLLNGPLVTQGGSLGTVPSNWSIIGTGDFNGDGNGDILWRDSTTGTVAIWLLNGLQVLQVGSLGSVPSNWSVVGLDDKGTIIWRDNDTGTVAIWIVNGFQVT
jgi:hypothetical protein